MTRERLEIDGLAENSHRKDVFDPLAVIQVCTEL